MKLIPVLGAGHGGLIKGAYQTAGKQSPKWSKGVLYEGMFNRWVVNRVIEKLDRLSIPYYHINPEFRDVSLRTRINRLNAIYKTNKNVYLLSIHANGGGGEGIEGYTSRGVTKSDLIMEEILKNLEGKLAEQKMRFDYSDGDRDKEAGFYVLKYSKCPAVLLECGFMDNKKDYLNLWDEKYLEVLVDALVESIVKIYNGKI